MKCYLCGNSVVFETIRDEVRHGIKRKVFRCFNCGLVFLEPKEKDLREFYREDYRKTYSPVIGESLDSKQIFDLYYPLQWSRLEAIRGYLGKNKRVLDIGCSAGHFLQAIRPFVKECVGIDLNEENARFVNEELGIKAYGRPVEETDLPKKYFDIIFSWQTVEHMDDPLKFLETIKGYLKEEGLVCIVVPNIEDVLLSVHQLEEYANFYYREPHLFYYSPKTLARLMKKAGYWGEVLPFQWYGLLNHLYWLSARKPQKSASDGLSRPDAWEQKSDVEYRKLLGKYMITDQIMFVGKTKGGRNEGSGFYG